MKLKNYGIYNKPLPDKKEPRRSRGRSLASMSFSGRGEKEDNKMYGLRSFPKKVTKCCEVKALQEDSNGWGLCSKCKEWSEMFFLNEEGEEENNDN